MIILRTRTHLTIDVMHNMYLISIIMAILGLAISLLANKTIYKSIKQCRDIQNNDEICNKYNNEQYNITILNLSHIERKDYHYHKIISTRYHLVEILVMSFIISSIWFLPFCTLIWIKCIICFCALIILFYTDLIELTLPDSIQIPLIVIGIFSTLPQLIWPLTRITTFNTNVSLIYTNGLQYAKILNIFNQPISLISSITGTIIGYTLLFIINKFYYSIRKTHGIGNGDFKMLSWLGAFWGPKSVIEILIFSTLLSCFISLTIMITKQQKHWQYTKIPFGCGMAIVTPLIIFYGPTIWYIYTNIILIG